MVSGQGSEREQKCSTVQHQLHRILSAKASHKDTQDSRASLPLDGEGCSHILKAQVQGGGNYSHFYNLLHLPSKNKVDSNNCIYLLIFGSAGSWCVGFSLVVVSRRVTVWLLSLQRRACGLQQLPLQGSRAQAQSSWGMSLIAPQHVGIFPDLGLNLCLLHQQVYSLPLIHQGSPDPNNFIHRPKMG